MEIQVNIYIYRLEKFNIQMQAISTCVCLLVLSAMAFAEDEEKTGRI